jgi:hypothetical protein
MDPRQVIIGASYEGEIMIAAGVPWTPTEEKHTPPPTMNRGQVSPLILTLNFNCQYISITTKPTMSQQRHLNQE